MIRDEQIARLMGIGALALLLGALGFQYFAHLAPCEMCHWQRWPHIAAAMVGLLGGGFLPRRFAVPTALAAILLVAVSGLIAAYQTRMQWGLLTGPTACTGQRFILGSNVIPEVQCDALIPAFLGQSLAFWNALISLGVATIAGILLSKTRHVA